MIADWASFKEEFKIYIVNNIGLFEINTPIAVCFDLDRFLIRQYDNIINKKQIPVKQCTLLAALSTFIDILETKQKVDINIFSKETIIYLNLLIDTKYITVNSSSNIFKDIMNYHKTNNKYEIEI